MRRRYRAQRVAYGYVDSLAAGRELAVGRNTWLYEYQDCHALPSATYPLRLFGKKEERGRAGVWVAAQGRYPHGPAQGDPVGRRRFARRGRGLLVTRARGPACLWVPGRRRRDGRQDAARWRLKSRLRASTVSAHRGLLLSVDASTGQKVAIVTVPAMIVHGRGRETSRRCQGAVPSV